MIGTLWTHVKSGRVYWIVGRCQLEATNRPAILYEPVMVFGETFEGDPWARDEEEFMDGRFERIENIERPPELGEEGHPFNPEAEGLRGALRLLRVSLFNEEYRRQAALRDAASLRMERAGLLEAMARETSRTGQEFFGPNANNFNAWIKRYAITKKETTDETDDA